MTAVLLDHGVNVEDSQMGILRGQFSMTLVIGLPDAAEVGRLREELEAVARRLGLDTLSLSEVDATEAEPPEPSHIVTVYGADHPGIVHAAASALAERGWSITDLNTRLVDDGEGEPLYALMMEVALKGASLDDLEESLAPVREGQGVEVSVHELEDDEL